MPINVFTIFGADRLLRQLHRLKLNAMCARIARIKDKNTRTHEAKSLTADCFNEGDISTAIMLIANFISGTPDNELFSVEWATILERRGETNNLVRLLKSIDLQEASAVALLQIDAIARRQKLYGVSLDALRTAIRRFPRSRKVVLRILNSAPSLDPVLLSDALHSAQSLLGTRESNDAQLAVTAANAAESSSVKENDCEFFRNRCTEIIGRQKNRKYWEAKRLFHKSRLDKAATLLDEHLDEDQYDKTALRLRVQISARQGKWGRDAKILMNSERDMSEWGVLAEKVSSVQAFFRTKGFELSDALDVNSPAFGISSPEDIVEAVCRRSSKKANNKRNCQGILMFAESLLPGGAEKSLAKIYHGLKQRIGSDIHMCLLANQKDPRDILYSLIQIDKELSRQVNFLDYPVKVTDKYLSALHLNWDKIAQAILDKISQVRPCTVYSTLDYVNILAAIASLRAGVPNIVLNIRNMRTTSVLETPGIETTFPRCYRALAERPEVHLVACSKAVAEDFREWCKLDSCHEISTVYNGYRFPDKGKVSTTDRNTIWGDIILPPDAIVVGTAMRLSWVKRPIRWIEAAKIVLNHAPTVYFVIFGSGELLNHTRDKAIELGLEHRIVFAGWEPDIIYAMNCMDIFMFSSGSEGFPNVLVEAQACGVPPIAYDVGGCRETMLPGITGKLVREETAQALANSVLEAINDIDWRRTASLCGQEFVRNNFSIESMLDRMSNLMTT